jgi:hypothetical protein
MEVSWVSPVAGQIPADQQGLPTLCGRGAVKSCTGSGTFCRRSNGGFFHVSQPSNCLAFARAASSITLRIP